MKTIVTTKRTRKQTAIRPLFWVANIDGSCRQEFKNAQEFEQEFNRLRTMGAQFTWHDPRD